MELNFPIKKLKYSCESHNNISIPLGGIGTGCVFLNSDGSLVNFKISNFSHSLLKKLSVSFSVSAESSGDVHDFDLVSSDEEGFNCFSGRDFFVTFPFGELSFEGSGFPGKINLMAYNPLIPHNNIDSTIPAAFLEYQIINNTEETITYSLKGSVRNPFNSPLNEFYTTKVNDICGIRIASTEEGPSKSGKAEFSLGINGENVDYLEYDNNNCCSVSSKIVLKPAESKVIRFIFSWYSTYGNSEIIDESKYDISQYSNTKLWKNYYTKYFTGADEIVYYCLSQWDRLYKESDLFRKLLYSSTIQSDVISDISKNIEYIKYPDFIRYEDGCVYPLTVNIKKEIVNSSVMTYLFPSLQRQILKNRYENDMTKPGAVSCISAIPSNDFKKSEPSAIRQLETILAVYKQFILSGNINWLSDIWPFVVKSVEYFWHPDNSFFGDPDKTGYIYANDNIDTDINDINKLYLQVLNASVKLAVVMKDKKHIKQFSEVLEKAIKHIGDFESKFENNSDYFGNGYGLLSDLCGCEIDLHTKSYKFCPDMSLAENGVFRCFLCFEGFLGFIECGIDYFQLNCLKGSIYVRNIEVPAEPLLVKAGGINIGFKADGNIAILDNDCEVNPKRDLFIVLRT